MTWWLHLPMLALAIPLPDADVCQRTQALLAADGMVAQCEASRPPLATIPDDVEAALRELIERGGT